MLTYVEYTEMGFNGATEDAFSSLEKIASNLINSMTFGVIERKGLLNDEAYSEEIKEAIGCQVDFMAQTYGSATDVMKASTESSVSSESETVGGYSHSVSYASNRKGINSFKGIKVCPSTEFLIAPLIAEGRGLY